MIKLALAVGYLLVRSRLKAEHDLIERQKKEIEATDKAKRSADLEAEVINS